MNIVKPSRKLFALVAFAMVPSLFGISAAMAQSKTTGQEAAKQMKNSDLVRYIDNRIGVIDNHGSNCVIGPQLPYGSINPSPQTKDGSHDGYNPKQPIRGFGQLHVSGTGWGKYGHFLISPQIGMQLGETEHDSPKKEEVANANYYKVTLTRWNITTEIAPSRHTALYRFEFPASDSACVVLDATQSIADIVPQLGSDFHQCKVTIDPAKKQVRSMIDFTGGWAGGPYKLYLITEYNKPFAESGVWLDHAVQKGVTTLELKPESKQRMGSFIRFKTKAGEKVMMKVALSFSGFDNAEKYLQQEIPQFDLEKVREAGRLAWQKKLNAIQIQGATEEQKTIFYTAFYHTLVQPRDRSGDNPKWKNNQPYWDDNFAIWDTWRTVYPLLTLIDPGMVRDNLLCFIDRFQHNGQVRDGFVAGVDMQAEQGGNDVDNIFADAYVKGVKGVDWQKAYEFLKHDAEKERKGLPEGWIKNNPQAQQNNTRYKELGWIPECMMSNSNTLEYNYNDFCVAEVAKGLGYTADYEKYLKRSAGWQNLWNPQLESDQYKGFIDARRADGTFVGMDAKQNGGSWKLPFYEGSSWTYSYLIPHDLSKLITLMGGREQFAERLNHAMEKRYIDYTNEPSFLAVRSFNEAGRPDLTSKWVHLVMNKYYDLTGVPGNDDTGAMSSWYIFSALGFFPNAGQDIYYLNAPLYPKSVITLGNGKTLTILAKNASPTNIYIASCKINGKVWNSSVFRHQEIANGGTIEMELSDQPTNWGR